MSYSISTTVRQPFDQALSAARDALSAQGFGVLTEIDMAATLRQKLDVEIPQQVILGACNPPLAHQALQAEESIGLLLPCNVVVRASAEGSTTVEALDPLMMLQVTGNEQLRPVAEDAARRLRAAIDAVEAA
ncbi:DUF302 domain-containing protein [Agrococcus sediminis]|uniref:DUF302 domain-containing protein n=1 Tax=Agrococcus sediminis TaxID=2599924 RepID=UPI0034365F18